MAHELRLETAVRFLFGILGGIILPFICVAGKGDPIIAGTAFLLCVMGELVERYLFFVAVAPPKMPGGI